MAKLYWRVKLNGKWTWRPAKVSAKTNRMSYIFNWKEEEDDPSEDYCRAVEEEE